MSTRLAGQVVAIFSSADRELSQAVSALGARVLSMPIAELATFSAGGRPLDLAIVDVRDTHQLPDDVTTFKRRHVGTSVVLVATSLEPALILDAMRAGITECLTEPITTGHLEAAITRVVAQRGPETAGEIFVFLGAKGGVGTTTVAVNVATALAQTRQKTLYIDLHVAYGDAAVFLGAEPKFSVVDALDNIHRLDDALFKTLVASTKCGVDLLASSSQGIAWTTDIQRVRRLLEFALDRYRYIVVDCPRTDAAVLDALEGATRIVLVANQELAALRTASRMATMLRQRYRAERVMVVVSRFDQASEIGHTDVERVVGAPVRHVMPSDYRSSLEALNLGTPLILKNHSRLASSLESLARELGGMTPPPAAPKSVGLLGRLTGKR